MLKRFTGLTPGIITCLVIAGIAMVLHRIPMPPFTLQNGQHPIESMTLALLLGIMTNNKFAASVRYQTGVRFCSKYVLYAAIVLLGARLSFHAIRQLSITMILSVILCILFSYMLTIMLSKRISMRQQPTTLIAFGTAICGSSAIAAIAPAIHAEKKDIALSMAVINIYGTLAIFIFPLAGHLFHISPTHFAVWAGTSIQAVPQVVAASFGYSTQSGILGTTVKLVRVLFLAPMLLLLIKRQQQKHSHTAVQTTHRLPWYQAIPPFITLFFLMVIVFNIPIPPSITPAFMTVKNMAISLSNLFMIIAMAAIGMHVSFHHLFASGKKPMLLAGLSFLGLTLFSLILSHFI